MSQNTGLTPADTLLIPATDPAATVGVFFTVAELRDAMSPIGYMTPANELNAAAAQAAQLTANAAIPTATLGQPLGPAQLDLSGTVSTQKVVYVGSGAVATPLQLAIGNVLNPAGYNASGSIISTTGTILVGSASLSLVSAIDFANGQGIYVTGAGIAGAPLITTIVSGAGTSVLVLAATASMTASGAVINHDDTAAWNAATLAASRVSGTGGGFTAVNGGGLTYNVSRPIIGQIGTVIQNAKAIPLPSPIWVGGAVLGSNAVFQASGGYNVIFENLEVDLNRVPNVNAFANTSTAFIKFSFCRAMHWAGSGMGMYAPGKADLLYCSFTQWNSGDAESLTPVTNNSGYGLWQAGSDSSAHGCNFGQGLRPVYVANGINNFRMTLCHTWPCNGNSTQILPDPCAIEIHGTQVSIGTHYLDSGYIGIYQEPGNSSPSVSIGAASQTLYNAALAPYPAHVKVTTSLTGAMPASIFIEPSCIFNGGAQMLLFATAAGIAVARASGNAGNGIVGTATPNCGGTTAPTLSSGAALGSYTLIATSSTTFSVSAVNSAAVAGTAIVGTAYTSGSINFLITAGTTSFAAGDSFSLNAANGTWGALSSSVQTSVLAAQAHSIQPTNGGLLIADVGSTAIPSTVMGNNVAAVAAVAGVANAGNGGLGSMSVSLGTPPGIFVLTATSTTSFAISGSATGTATVGTPYTSTAINFLLTAGSTSFAVGDIFTLTATAGYSLSRYIDGGTTINAAPEFGSNGNDAVMMVDNVVRLRGSNAGLGVILGQSTGLEGYVGNTSVTSSNQKTAHQFLSMNTTQPWVAGFGMPGGVCNNKSAWFWGTWDSSGAAGTNMKTACYSDGSLVHPTFDYVISEFGSLANIAAAGTYQIASSTVALQGELAGTYEIYWSSTTIRLQHMIVSVGCAKGDNSALVTILHNWCKGGNAVVAAPMVVQDASGNAYLVVTVTPGAGGTLSAQARGYSTGVSVSATPGGSTVVANQLASLNNTAGPAASVNLTPTITSYAYTAAAAGQLSIYAGTISSITRKRGSNTIHYNAAASEITVGVGDTVTVINTAVPTMTFFPA